MACSCNPDGQSLLQLYCQVETGAEARASVPCGRGEDSLPGCLPVLLGAVGGAVPVNTTATAAGAGGGQQTVLRRVTAIVAAAQHQRHCFRARKPAFRWCAAVSPAAHHSELQLRVVVLSAQPGGVGLVGLKPALQRPHQAEHHQQLERRAHPRRGPARRQHRRQPLPLILDEPGLVGQRRLADL